jgi:hypothetical protein
MSVLGLLFAACGIQRLDAGSKQESDVGSAPEPPLWPFGMPSNSFEKPCSLPPPHELAGTWLGDFDSHRFASGSSAIRIDVLGAFDQPDGLCGTVTFGKGKAPPLATDPEAFPPGEPPDPDPSFGSTPLEGFPYEFYQSGRGHFFTIDVDGGVPQFVDAGFSDATGAVDGDRVHFGITLRQPMKSWCNLQFSYSLSGSNSAAQTILSGGRNMNCIPPSAIADDGHGDTQCFGIFSGVPFRGVSCAQAEYCALQACDCEASSFENKSPPHGCSIRMTGEAPFNLILNGAELSGTVTFSSAFASETLSVHLTRAQ